jgi:hypothetical protein
MAALLPRTLLTLCPACVQITGRVRHVGTMRMVPPPEGEGMATVDSYESVSTWRQSEQRSISPARQPSVTSLPPLSAQLGWTTLREHA